MPYPTARHPEERPGGVRLERVWLRRREARFAGVRPAALQLFRAARGLVRTHAFRLAGLYFLVFAVSVIGVLFFVYWTSADFVARQTEATLDAEITGLAEQYAQ